MNILRPLAAVVGEFHDVTLSESPPVLNLGEGPLSCEMLDAVQMEAFKKLSLRAPG